MDLPESWVDHILGRLHVAYGETFAKQYVDLDPAKVKQSWARTLAGFEDRKQALTFALDNLPADRPPNAMQFRELAKSYPDPSRFQQLPAPKPERQDPTVLRAVSEGLAKARQERAGVTPAQYTVLRLREVERQNGRLTIAQREQLAAAERAA